MSESQPVTAHVAGWLFHVEIRWWRVRNFVLSWVLHSRDSWYWYRKWCDRPHVGDTVIDCRGVAGVVTAVGDNEDDLVVDHRYRCSWMHCCDKYVKLNDLDPGISV